LIADFLAKVAKKADLQLSLWRKTTDKIVAATIWRTNRGAGNGNYFRKFCRSDRRNESSCRPGGDGSHSRSMWIRRLARSSGRWNRRFAYPTLI